MEEQLDNPNSPLIARHAVSIHFRLLGILPLAFFLIQGIHYWKIGELGNMLWMCNLGNLLLAIGIFLINAKLIRVAVLWMIPGLVIWIIYVVLAWGVFLSSTLAHVGGLFVGIVALRKIGMDQMAWLYALLWYFLVQILSRLLTPPALNVNVSHSIDPGWQSTFNSYWKFWTVGTLVTALVLGILDLVLSQLFPVSSVTQTVNLRGNAS